MTNKKKRISIAVCTVALSLAMSTAASAVTTYTTTSGGTGGKVTIRSQIYSKEYNPTGDIFFTTYEVTSDIPAESSLKTNFDIEAKLINSNSSKSLNKSGYANSVTASSSQSGPDVVLYDYLESKTTTNSTAFGTSSHECNGAV